MLAGLLLLGTGSCGRKSKDDHVAPAAWSPATTIEQALQRGMAFLVDQQAKDGGWHSPAYGAMQPGAPITANILYGLAHVPEPFTRPYHDRLKLACQFLAQGIDEHGYVTNPDGSPNYPNYASAMLLIADQRLQLGLSAEHRKKLVQFLVASQLGTQHGYSLDDPDFGGWDFMGWDLGPRLSAGTNVSVTRIVIEALADERDQLGVDECLQRAEEWLRRCQNLPRDSQQLGAASPTEQPIDGDVTKSYDGGFHFHPKVEHDGNKAGWLDATRSQAVSYGTATADGLCALLSLGVPCHDPRVQAAIIWLQQHPAVVRVPGFEKTTHSLGWEQGLLFYFYSGIASANQETWRACSSGLLDGTPIRLDTTLPEDDPREPIAIQLAGRIVRAQQRNGSWENSSNRMREDDPLIATPFAMAALGNLVSPDAAEASSPGN